MTNINSILGMVLGFIMKLCYNITNNYGLAIVLFTLLSKIILLPVSIWVQKNSIKMIRIQPAINNLKVKFFGDKDRIAEEQGKLLKREKYNPLASVIPLILQLVLLMGIIQVIYHPFGYILGFTDDLSSMFVNLANTLTPINLEASSVQLSVIEVMQNSVYTNMFKTISYDSMAVSDAIESVLSLNMKFIGLNLGWVPQIQHGISLLVPLAAGISAWFLSFMQNRINVLQAEQSNFSKYGMMTFSIGLSLFLGFFVPVGVGIYWIASNLFTIIQMLILNAVINPKKYINYEELEKSKIALLKLDNMEEKKSIFTKDPYKKREKQDYKKFFSIANKHLVFYSESSGFYKYFKGIIEYLLKHTNLKIHYITNDPNDIVFELAKENENLKPYYIGPTKIITLMMKMDAKIVVMTTPDIDTYHIKRSYMRDDIEYIYVQHTITSIHMTLSKTALNNFDTVFCVGQHQVDEIRAAEKIYNLKEKELVPVGYHLLEELIDSYELIDQAPNKIKKILIAPSWQEDNIMDSCLDGLINNFSDENYQVIVRPHPEYVKRYSVKMENIKSKYKNYPKEKLVIEDDFSANTSIFSSDILITDWSNVAFEFSYATKKPSLYIDTKMKVVNDEYEKNQNKPLDIMLRDVLGKSLSLSEVSNAKETVNYLIENKDNYKEIITNTVNKYVFNLGFSSRAGANYIISKLQRKN